ncbi:MAG: hypothetical protein JSR24_04780 [Proteobacteria bacterium]|nr:hypothetical protein [Pseudomonadota bacterium]
MLIGLLAGMQSARRADELFRFAQTIRRAVASHAATTSPTDARRGTFNEFDQLVAYPGKREVPPPAITSRTMVAFVFGQSNSANHGGEKFAAASEAVLNYWNSRYFVAEDPLLGASGLQGGPWTLMANRLVADKTFDSVVLEAAGISATTVRDWATGGRLNVMLEKRLADTKAAGLTVTHFLWHQGEEDNNEAGVAGYDAAMRTIIDLAQKYFPKAKFLIAQASICYRVPPNGGLRQIQRDLTRLPGVFAGPDTDEIGEADRYDDCHLSGRGLERHADGWVAAVRRAAK